MLFVFKKNPESPMCTIYQTLMKTEHFLLQKYVEILYNFSVHNKQLPLQVLQAHICTVNCAHTGLGSSPPTQPGRQEGMGSIAAGRDRLKPHKLCHVLARPFHFQQISLDKKGQTHWERRKESF